MRTYAACAAVSNGTISVSEDKLRAVLAEFKLELFEGLSDRLDRKADLVHLTDARKDVIKLRERVESLERWRAYLTGMTAFAVALALFLVQHIFIT